MLREVINIKAKSKLKIRKQRIYFAKILIAIAVALLCYGLILDIHNEIRLVDPVNGVQAGNDDDGSYTSVDKNGNSPSNDVENYENNDSVEQNHTVSIEEANNALRNSIQKKYSITIKYGSETANYYVGELATQSIDDPNVINNSLNILNDILGLYPQGLFKEIYDGGIPLTIYLINNYSENAVTGATDSNYSFADISIAVVHPIDETFFHESYHYIERYILKRGLSYNVALWNSYNPDGFSYGTIINNYSYKSTFLENAYFVNNYAQTSAEEDRASTFEYMMASSKASCLNHDMPIWRKAVTMSNTIDVALNSVSSNNTEYWERFL